MKKQNHNIIHCIEYLLVLKQLNTLYYFLKFFEYYTLILLCDLTEYSIICFFLCLIIHVIDSLVRIFLKMICLKMYLKYCLNI